MNRNFEDSYYHGGVGSGNRHDDERRNDLRDGDYGREYENRYRNQDGRNRKSYDDYRSRQTGESYYPYSSGFEEAPIRRRPGVEDLGRGGYGYDSDRNGSYRTPGQQSLGGYGTGRMGGYSGAAFGGSNYSSKGTFGGDDTYGSMSGGGGNMSRGASSSGYGSSAGNFERDRSGYGSNQRSQGYGTNKNTGPVNYSGPPDRGDYTGYDPNTR